MEVMLFFVTDLNTSTTTGALTDPSGVSIKGPELHLKSLKVDGGVWISLVVLSCRFLKKHGSF